ncbi:hypothetical protein D3C80_1920050 [compost metagenome]
MVRIFVIALSRIKWNARCVLFRKAQLRRFLVRMNLNRQRLIGAKYLEQERQFAETVSNCLAQQRVFIRIDHIAQRAYLAVGIFNF